MKAGRWWGTFRQMVICAPNNCIVWPATVRSVENLIYCNEVIPFRNSFFEYQQFVPPPGLKRCEYDCVDQLLDRGMTPVFLEPVGTNKKLRLYAASSTDYGKRVLIDGLDANGQRIRTYDSVTDVWVFGEYVTLATPFSLPPPTSSRHPSLRFRNRSPTTLFGCTRWTLTPAKRFRSVTTSLGKTTRRTEKRSSHVQHARLRTFPK